MNGFEQIKGFYSWVFNNPDKIRPTHISLYLFLWNQANRANWAEWVKIPYDLAMQGACIGNNGTYYKCLDDLKRFGLIEYTKGLNNYKAPLVHLIQLYNSEQLTEQVTVPLSEQLTAQQYAQLTEQLPVHIYKLITNNLKLITDNINEFENSISNLGKPKNKKEFDLSFINGDYEFIFKRWISYKKEIKDSYRSQDSLEQAYKNLIKISSDNVESATEIVEHSIGNGYKGLFAPKKNNHKSPEPESKAAKTLRDFERITMEKVEQSRREEELQNS